MEIMSLGEIDHDPCYSMMTTSVISILHSPNVHTLHCQPRASRSETMENETHNPHIFTVTIINNTQLLSFAREICEARAATLMRIMTECRADRGVYIRLDVTPSTVYCVDTGMEE